MLDTDTCDGANLEWRKTLGELVKKRALEDKEDIRVVRDAMREFERMQKAPEPAEVDALSHNQEDDIEEIGSSSRRCCHRSRL